MNRAAYLDFLGTKRGIGSAVPRGMLSDELAQQAIGHLELFSFQRAIVSWSLGRPAAAVFADTGLGKSRILLAYAEASVVHGDVLVLTPLCTAQQLAVEAEKMRVRAPVHVIRGMAQVVEGPSMRRIYVANYEIAMKFDLKRFGTLILDESSILKHRECATGQWIISNSQDVPRRLSLSATPCPNDYAEIMNQSAFLGVATYDQLLNTFFIREDRSKVRLRPHAAPAFSEWLSQWSVWLSSPADIGFSAEARLYQLPPLRERHIMVPVPTEVGGAEEGVEEGAEGAVEGGGVEDGDGLEVAKRAKTTDKAKPKITKTTGETPGKRKKKTATGGGGIVSRMAARRTTLQDRIARCCELVNADDGTWIVWCTLNDESRQLAKGIRGAVELCGSDSQQKKDAALQKFMGGRARVLVTKSEIAGFGLNFQHCHKMVFASLTDSYERMYQAVRRCHRFGQTRPVEVTSICTEMERAVLENLQRKAGKVGDLKLLMRQRMQDLWDGDGNAQRPPLHGLALNASRKVVVSDSKTSAAVIHGDCVTAMMEHLGDDSVDYIVFSPPFQSLYRYSPSAADISNCHDGAQFEKHMRFVAAELLRVLKPGRLMSSHVMNICRRRVEHGDELANSLVDLRGQLTRIFEEAGFLLHSEVCVFRDPTQALIRTKAQGLFYRTYATDAAIARQALPDYVITFRKRGQASVKIEHKASGDTMDKWIRLACPVWFVRSTNTLNVKKILAAAPGLNRKTSEVLVGALEGSAAAEDGDDAGADADADADVSADVETAEATANSSAPDEDQKHPTPLQLEIIENCVDLWSNPGELVLDPFSGIGSTGHVCKRMGRSYVGIELDARYFEASLGHV